MVQAPQYKLLLAVAEVVVELKMVAEVEADLDIMVEAVEVLQVQEEVLPAPWVVAADLQL